MKKIILTYGLACGLVISVSMLASMALWGDKMNFDAAEIAGYASMIVALSTIFFGIHSYRKKQRGVLSFGKAFQIGLGITLVASALYVTSWMIGSSLVAPDFMEHYYTHTVENLKKSGVGPAELEAKIAEMETYKEMYKNPFIKAGLTFLEIFPVGLLVTLVAALVLKRKNTHA